MKQEDKRGSESTVYRLRTIEGDSFLPIIFPGIISRQLGGKHMRTPTSIWSFNPGTFSKTDSRREEFMKTRSPSKLQSKGWISEKGYRISILLDSNIAGAFQKWNKEKIDMKKLLDSSRMKPSGMKLSDLGFEGRISKNRLELNLAKPESMIKWGPRIRSCKGIELEIRFPLVDSENIVRCGIRNLSKDSGKVTAHLVLGETDLGGWIYNDFPHTPELGKNYRRKSILGFHLRDGTTGRNRFRKISPQRNRVIAG